MANIRKHQTPRHQKKQRQLGQIKLRSFGYEEVRKESRLCNRMTLQSCGNKSWPIEQLEQGALSKAYIFKCFV